MVIDLLQEIRGCGRVVVTADYFRSVRPIGRPLKGLILRELLMTMIIGYFML